MSRCTDLEKTYSQVFIFQNFIFRAGSCPKLPACEIWNFETLYFAAEPPQNYLRAKFVFSKPYISRGDIFAASMCLLALITQHNSVCSKVVQCYNLRNDNEEPVWFGCVLFVEHHVLSFTRCTFWLPRFANACSPVHAHRRANSGSFLQGNFGFHFVFAQWSCLQNNLQRLLCTQQKTTHKHTMP